MTSPEFELTPVNRLIISYSRARLRPWFEGIFAFDQQLAKIVRVTTEPLLGQIRYQWWHDVISQAPDTRPSGNPVLSALTELQRQGLESAPLLTMIRGWEMLLGNDELTPEMVQDYAQKRGGAMFGAIALQASASNIAQYENLGRIFALWDLARHCTDPKMTNHLTAKVAEELPWLETIKIERSLRPLSIWRHIIRLDIGRQEIDLPLMRPRTAMRIIGYGLSGR